MIYLLDRRDGFLIRVDEQGTPELYNKSESQWITEDWLDEIYTGDIVTIKITKDDAEQIISNKKTYKDIIDTYNNN